MARDRTHEGQARKTWTRPVCRRLRAGLAEATPGAQIADATLETIGS